MSGADLAFFKKQNGYALFSKVNRTSEPCWASTDDDYIERLIGIRDSDNKILSSFLPLRRQDGGAKGADHLGIFRNQHLSFKGLLE